MSDKIFRDLGESEAPLRHVDAESRTTKRDRFGNRVFQSKDRSYEDREKNETRSALLVSREGEQFIKENPGILTALSKGLAEHGPRIEGRDCITPEEPIDLGNGCTLRYLAEGGQSVVYTLDVPGRRYIVKVHLPYSSVHQPYINEVLQSQSIEHDRAHELQTLGVALPKFLFASGQMMCVEYVPNEASLPEDFVGTYYAAATAAEDYIAAQKQQDNALWNNVSVDKVSGGKIPASNFRRREDGTIVWIDPVAYFPNEGPREPNIVLSDDELAEITPLTVQQMRDTYPVAAAEVQALDSSIMDFDASDDASWVAHMKEELQKHGVNVDSEERYLAFGIGEAKRNILKKYNIRWML